MTDRDNYASEAMHEFREIKYDIPRLCCRRKGALRSHILPHSAILAKGKIANSAKNIAFVPSFPCAFNKKSPRHSKFVRCVTISSVATIHMDRFVNFST